MTVEEIEWKIRHLIRERQIYTEENGIVLFLKILLDFTFRQPADGTISGWICKCCWVGDAAPQRSIITEHDQSHWQPPVNPLFLQPCTSRGLQLRRRLTGSHLQGFLFLSVDFTICASARFSLPRGCAFIHPVGSSAPNLSAGVRGDDHVCAERGLALKYHFETVFGVHLDRFRFFFFFRGFEQLTSYPSQMALWMTSVWTSGLILSDLDWDCYKLSHRASKGLKIFHTL